MMRLSQCSGIFRFELVCTRQPVDTVNMKPACSFHWYFFGNRIYHINVIAEIPNYLTLPYRKTNAAKEKQESLKSEPIPCQRNKPFRK